ncbi:MAG: large repetitive protein, partial [Solirubrobacteraceae bacterium]|nr:large repetitive protein [Solirubrobacteraceae bacterium]
MHRRPRALTRIVLVAAFALLFAAPPALAVDNTFTGAVNGNWNTAGNWSLNHAPDGTEDAKLNAAATLDTGADAAVKSITVNAAAGLTVSGGKQLTVGVGSSSIAAGVTLRDGAVLTLNGPTTWSAGSIGFGGTSVASLENNGVLTVTGASPIALHTVCCMAGFIHNNVGATINRSSGTGDFQLNVPIDNDGTLTVGTGKTSTAFDSSATSKGAFSIASGAELALGAALPLESGASITGAGTLRVHGIVSAPAGVAFSPHDLILESGDLQLDSTGTIAGTLAMTGGQRSGIGTLTVNGGSTIGSGRFDGTGTTNLDGATTTQINGDAFTLTGGHTLHLHAPAHWSAGDIKFGGAAVASLEVDGGMTIDGDLTVRHAICCSAGRFHVPSGATVTRASGTGDLTMSVPFDNDGALALNTGKLAVTFDENGSTGTFTLASGTEFRTVAGTYGLASGAQMSGAGTVRVQGGGLSVASGATLAPTDLSVGGGILDLAADVTAGTLTMAGGSRTGAAKLTVNGATTISGGSFDGVATTELKAHADLTGNFELKNGHTLKLGPTTTWSAGQIGFGGSSDAVLLNPGTFTVAGDLTADNPTCCFAGIIRNTGTFNRTTSAGTLTLDVHVENSGAFNLQTGTLSDPTFAYTQTAGITTLSPGTTLAATDTSVQGGTLRGAATVDGPLTNSGGIVAPGASPGTLTVTGDYTQGA